MEHALTGKRYAIRRVSGDSVGALERVCNEMWDSGYRLVLATAARGEGGESHFLYFEKTDSP